MLLPVELEKEFLFSKSYMEFISPLLPIFADAPPLVSQGNRELKFKLNHQVTALIYYHIKGCRSGNALVQSLNEDDFAKAFIAPEGGVQRSTFFEAMSTRGLQQLQFIFQELYKLSGKSLPSRYTEFGDVKLVDGSLIDAVFSMEWADYRRKTRKAKGHFAFDLNKGVPSAVYLTDGKGSERAFASVMLSPNQTGVFDRGYQEHRLFDSLDEEGKFFVCRIRKNTVLDCISENIVNTEDYILYDQMAYIGTAELNQTRKPYRVICYQVGNTKYFIVTNRMDLSAEQIALVVPKV